MTARTPDWLVERLHAGDLPPAEAERVRGRLEAEGGLGRLDALQADDARFRETHPPGPSLASISSRARAIAPPRQRRRLLIAVPATLAAAAAVTVLAVWTPGFGPDDVRMKGPTAHLEVFRRQPSSDPERLRDGAAARAGDVLQLSVVVAGRAHAAVISIDGRGAVTRHWPESGPVAGALEGGDAVPLPHAYQLDDAPGFERFFLVTASRPFDVEVVLEAGRRLAASGRARDDRLPLPASLDQQVFLVGKESR